MRVVDFDARAFWRARFNLEPRASCVLRRMASFVGSHPKAQRFLGTTDAAILSAADSLTTDTILCIRVDTTHITSPSVLLDCPGHGAASWTSVTQRNGSIQTHFIHWSTTIAFLAELSGENRQSRAERKGERKSDECGFGILEHRAGSTGGKGGWVSYLIALLPGCLKIVVPEVFLSEVKVLRHP